VRPLRWQIVMVDLRPFSPATITEYRPEYLPAYVSNGLLGLRVGRIPPVDGLCMVAGLVERDPVEDGEGFARAPYPLWGDLTVDGDGLTGRPEQARLIEQHYDLATGELRSRFVFRPRSVAVTAEDLVFCSRSLPTLALHEVSVQVDRECDLVLSGGVNHSGLSGQWISRRTQTPGTDTPVVDGLMEWEASGGLSTCGAAYVSTLEGAGDPHRWVDDIDQRAPLRTSYAFRAQPGRSYVLRQITSLLSSRLHTEPDRMAARMAYLGRTRGFDAVRRENRAAWTELWKGRPILHGASERWQTLADASFYYLHSSAHPSSIFGTATFGLANWPNYHYYRGHVMWDIEGFAVPVFILTDPQIAKSLLEYRLERLGAARRNAAINGYAGVQFPWAASAVHGEEVIRLSKARVIFEQHVNMAVAFAFARYCHATLDDEYLRDHAWPVLSGVARWIASRGVDTARGFEIHECLGVAEQEMPVDNHAYVNMAAAVVLREAAAAARRLGLSERGWGEIADRVYVPVDERTNVIINHDGYVYREGDVASATPSALAGLFPFTYDPGAAREQATLRFYLDRVGPYVGYPMLSAPLGAWAALMGDRQLSARLFEEGYADFVEEPFLVTNEFSRRFPDEPRAGPLMANVGGFLMSLLYGLTGLVLGPGEPASWARRTAVMPTLWNGVEVERIWARGRAMRLVATHGSPARLEPLQGEPHE
jgi:protein-glucosylgalactosylhydroxylysine glucosidase